ncbi:MAG: hypothetical protein M1536_02210 [Firmicutes bacterium]|nr:hypothetical protein [Bacillota bacterium]
MDSKTQTEFKKTMDTVLPKVLKIMEDRNLTGIQMEAGELFVEIKKMPQAMFAPASAETASEDEEGKHQIIPVTSELVGIFKWNKPGIYEPMVVKGDNVKKGQVLGFIESMKFLHEVAAPESGKVAEILAEEGTPVEYGQALIVLEKLT